MVTISLDTLRHPWFNGLSQRRPDETIVYFSSFSDLYGGINNSSQCSCLGGMALHSEVLVGGPMRLFPHPNSPWTCPVCGKDTDEAVVLIGIQGTEEGNNMEAVQVHFDCLRTLRWYKGAGVIATPAPHKEAR